MIDQTSNAETMGARIKARRKALNMSQTELSILVGMGQPTLSAMERDEIEKTKFVVELAAALKVNALWLQTGRGDPTAMMKGVSTQPGVDVMDDGKGGHALHRIPIVESRGSCGGADPSRRDVREIMAALDPICRDAAFFESLGVPADEVACVIADGDGMANYIAHGDSVFFHTKVDQVISGGIYAISTPDGGVQIRRVSRRMDRTLIMSFDNLDKARYPDEAYRGDEADAIMFFGKLLRREG